MDLEWFKKQKNIFILIGLAIVFLLVFLRISYNFEISENGYRKSIDIAGEGYEEVFDNTEFSQKISLEHENLKYINLKFGSTDYNYKEGNYIVSLIDSNGNILKEDKISFLDIKNNFTYKFYTKSLKLDIDEIYTISMRYEGEKQSEFYPMYNASISDSFYINNDETIGSLDIQMFYKVTYKYTAFYILALLLFVVFLCIIFFLLYKKDISITRTFLIVGFIIYILYYILMPVYTAHDELYQWVRAYEVSDGVLVSDINGKYSGAELPSGIILSVPNFLDVRYSDYKDTLNQKIDDSNTYFVSNGTMAVYSPVQFIPQALGISFAKIFTDNTMVITYMARLFNMLFSLIILWLTLKILPFGKNIFLVLAFLPIAIEGFTSLSGDAITICVSFLFIAYILKLLCMESEKLKKKDIIIITILGVVLAFCKLVYLPVFFLLLLLPFKKFKKKSHYFITIGILVSLVCLCNLIWLKLAGPHLDTYTNGVSNMQISFILRHPIQYIQIFLNTLEESGMSYILTLFGSGLAWAGLVKNYFFVPIGFLSLTIFVVLSDKTLSNKLKTSHVVIMTLVSLAVIALIFTSLFIQWTPAHDTIIRGVQGRYFIPIIPLVLLILGNIKKKWPLNPTTNITKIVFISCLILHFSSLLETFVRFI